VNCELNKNRLAGGALISLFLFALPALAVVVCHGWAEAVKPLAEPDKKITVQGCAQLTASDPRFGPLAQVCQYALSPSNLPSFVCDESVQQFASSSGPRDWQHLAVVTAVVACERGKGDRFSNVTKDGNPIRALSKPHNTSDIQTHFSFNLKSRPPVLNLFGSHLLWVFDRKAKGEFEYRGEMNADDGTMIVFGYRVRKGNGPSFGWNWPGQSGTYAEMKGLLWIDKTTLSLRRIVVHYTDFDPEVGIAAASSATNYGWVEISDLGKFLLPTAAEYIQCNQSGYCAKDVLAFSNCHKYAGKSRILPAE
jgi:hypothetical protein